MMLVPILSLAASIPLGAYWGVGLVRLIAAARLPSAGRALAWSGAPMAEVAVIIAAHDEKERLPALVESLRAQDQPGLTFIIALDRCTDGSREAMRGITSDDARWRIVEVDSCPPGWTGKVHAIHRALAEIPSTATWLLFLDADVKLDARCIRAAMTLASHRGLDLVSLLPKLSPRGWREAVTLPWAVLELLHHYPLHKVNRERKRRALANGQFLLIRREAHERLGGHESIRDELLEDIALARRARDAGLRAGVFIAAGLMRIGASPSFDQTIASWRRILGEACRRRIPRLVRGGWRLRIMGTLLPFAAAASLALPGGSTPVLIAKIAATASLTAYFTVMVAAWRMSGAPIAAALGAPLGSWVVGGWMLRAARELRSGIPTRWGGMDYARGTPK